MFTQGVLCEGEALSGVSFKYLQVTWPIFNSYFYNTYICKWGNSSSSLVWVGELCIDQLGTINENQPSG